MVSPNSERSQKTNHPMPPSKRKSGACDLPYAVHPSIAHSKKILDNLPKTTGRSLAEWTAFLKRECPNSASVRERRDCLLQTQKVSQMVAGMIADISLGGGRDYADPDAYLEDCPGYIETLYSGPKAPLRPIHDKLISLAMTLGPELKISPCKTIIPLYRNRVFAQIKPATLKRIDFGMALKGSNRKPPDRVIDTGGLAKNDRITHRIALSTPDEVDDFVAEWMRHAFDLDAEK